MSDVVLTLGPHAFVDFETPERINFGGEQVLNTHSLVGGAKVFDAMGASEDPIEWSGRFRGDLAVQTAQAIDALRKAGTPVALTWGAFSFTVLVRQFRPVYERDVEIPYSIVCEVVTADQAAAQAVGVDQMVKADAGAIQTLGARILAGVATVEQAVSDVQSAIAQISNAILLPAQALTGLLVDLDDAVSTVPNFARADLSALQGVLTPLLGVQQCVGTMILGCESAADPLGVLGSVVAGGRPSAMAASLFVETAAMTEVADLYDLHNLTGRMATNLAAIGSGGAVVTVAGANLYEIASQFYGDASEWATLAKANGVAEPMLDGIRSILVPPQSGQTGGVLLEIIGSDATLADVAATDQGAGDFGELDFSNPDDAIFISV